jgi:hypothetical protein
VPPLVRRGQQVCGAVADGGAGEARAGGGDGAGGDVERGGLCAAAREEFRVEPRSEPDDEGAQAGEVAAAEPVDQQRMRRAAVPRDDGGTVGRGGVQVLEPAGGVVGRQRHRGQAPGVRVGVLGGHPFPP